MSILRISQLFLIRFGPIFEGKANVRSRQGQGKVKVKLRQDQGKVNSALRQGKANAMSRQGKGKINVRLKQSNHNNNHNYNVMGYDTIEINLVFFIVIFDLPQYIKTLR